MNIHRLRNLFHRHVGWRFQDREQRHPVLLDYPIHPRPRYGEGAPPHGVIQDILSHGNNAYRERVTEFGATRPGLLRIPETAADAGPSEPYWGNLYFSALDAITLYALMGGRHPNLYLEVGSGNSTKFARRAIRDFGLSTRIVSLDPHPRADIDAICDHVIRAPMEDVDLSVFDAVRAGDILFVDNSHRVFQNSDVTVFFLDVLPRLVPGVLLHVHDIFLPYDYPSLWKTRHYSEQYLLAAYLLGGSLHIEPYMPLVHVSEDADLGELVRQTFTDAVFQRSFEAYRAACGYIATSFWALTT